ncbi:hypothetical protein GUITHDRAFT_111831 [Guillardia theta CCMP2712]|uniref:CRAL-TRIO domain-containing protein n=1 Tax=Guillardia theta (strain CCMP2712) TaxID=905079 RepID=L1J2D5_GUITC|nr:hypothetical protein GUITHDRAFT_111831 [Guillardia theta CCMP2712]EKX42269.1 hypothetical protein GUITHDRAFT_111831 [Guillardia theta CCMP2712]|eukprot:XP_005829249.1 hypothetical protein GUITHDRAFT_111831 [Guillardia theta CCMP2712]
MSKTKKTEGAGKEELSEGLSSSDLSSQSMQILDEDIKVDDIDEKLLRRFLRAHQMDAGKAAHKLRRFFAWKESCSYGLDFPVKKIDQTSPGVQRQLSTGKCYILRARDKNNRPVIVVNVKQHDPNFQTYDELTIFGVYLLNSAEALLADDGSSGPDQFLIIFNLEGITASNIDYRAAKRVIYMLTNFYPERMGVCLLLSAPVLFSAFWVVIRPWLHPVTQAKVKFAKKNDLKEFLDVSQLPVDLGGEDAYKYF